MPDHLIENEGRVLRVNGQRFHAVWLADNAPSSQRTPALAAPLNDIRLLTANIVGDSVALTFAPDSTPLSFSLKWLKDHAYDTPKERSEGHMPAGSTPWGSTIKAAMPTAPFPTLKAYEATQLSWLDAIRSYGLAKVTETAGPVHEIIEIFTPAECAVTSNGNDSRAPELSLEIITCAKDEEESTVHLSDGFACAIRLKNEDPEGFAALAHHSASFVFADQTGRPFTARAPLVSLLPEGTIAAIHFAPQSAAPLTDVPFEQMEVYYRAYRHFSELVDSPEMQISVTLKEGEALVIENTRILRGTTDSHTAQRTFADRNSLLASLTALETTP